MGIIGGLQRLHDDVFDAIQRATDGWLLGLLARFVFASTLFIYFMNAAFTKLGSGVFVDLDNALQQMAPIAYEAAGFDASAMGIHYYIMAYAGTYGEVLLPLLVVIGLFTRLASLGMIVFIAVQTFVDVTGHGVALNFAKAFDGLPTDKIVDQRLFWVFPLIYLALRGAGAVSVDYVLRNFVSSGNQATLSPQRN